LEPELVEEESSVFLTLESFNNDIDLFESFAVTTAGDSAEVLALNSKLVN
jgi:hypothetical protein